MQATCYAIVNCRTDAEDVNMTKKPIYPDVSDILESMYSGVCDVYVTRTETDRNGVERDVESLLYEGISCRKISDSVPVAAGGIVSDVEQRVTLLLGRRYQIPPGSKIVVTEWEITQEFTNSGEPDYYLSHQEIPINLIESRA